MTQRLEPFAADVALLCSIAGIKQRAAEVILAELGPDMAAWPDARHLCSWAALCPGNDQSGDQFGWAFAAGDFDGDGFADLAVGHPGEDVLGNVNTGAVTLLMGAPNANLGARVGALAAGVDGLPDVLQAHSDFGRAMCIGDFGGDGFADLVVGVPWYNTLDDVDAGLEIVLYGSLFSDGFETGSTARWSSETP